MLILRGGLYLSPEGDFIEGDIHISGDKIQYIGKGGSMRVCREGTKQRQVIDLKGKRVLPGLIDMHTHGAMGYDVSQATPSQLCELSRYYAKQGITSFMPTTITTSEKHLIEILKNIRGASQMDCEGATIEGVHIEGPFINAGHKGAHNPGWIRVPKQEDFDQFREILGDLKIHITMAPEIEGGLEFIEYVVDGGGSIGLGHTDGDYEIILEAVEAGASTFTHLFNAMKGLHHREPGVVGAALSCDAFAEIIPDGLHLHPAVVKTAIKAKGIERSILVTDSMHAAGLKGGIYDFGGFKISIDQGVAKQEDGTIAGSIISLMDGVKNVMKFADISLEDAVAMTTINPARVLGLEHEIGSIEPGKRGDLAVVDQNLKVEMVFCRGKRVL